MKKILLSLSFFLMCTNVYAFESGVWTDEVINDSKIMIKGSETRYKWYKNVLEISPDYYLEGENDVLYPNIKSDDFIETAYSEWSDERPAEKTKRTTETRSIGRYRTLRPIRYLFLENFQGGYLTYKINELNILIDNQKIKVNINCINCSSNFNTAVTDGILMGNSYINNGGRLIIDLGNYYGIEKIKVEFYMFDMVPGVKKFNLYFNEGNSLDDRSYAHKEIASYVVSANNFQSEKYVVIADSSFITNKVYGDWIYTNGCVNSTYYRQMQFISEYRYKDIKYRYYNDKHIYLDGYYKELNDPKYIADKGSAKTFYLYEYTSDSNLPPSDDKKIITPEEDKIIPNVDIIKDTKIVDDNVDNDKVNNNTLDNSIIANIPFDDDKSNEQLIIDDKKPSENKKILALIDNKNLVEKNNQKMTINNLKYILIILSFGLLLILVFTLIKIRHHNLSHQN